MGRGCMHPDRSLSPWGVSAAFSRTLPFLGRSRQCWPKATSGAFDVELLGGVLPGSFEISLFS